MQSVYTPITLLFCNDYILTKSIVDTATAVHLLKLNFIYCWLHAFSNEFSLLRTVRNVNVRRPWPF